MSASIRLNAWRRTVPALLLAFVCQFAIAGAYEDMLDAVRRDDTKAVAGFLKRGFDANTTDAEGNSLLMLAIKESSAGSVKLLLETRVQINARNALGENALMLAAMAGQLEIVRNLLLRGAQPNQAGWTPLMYAAFNGSVEISRLLLAYGAQINATADNGYTALMMAAREGHPELVSWLIAQGADPGLKTMDGLTALSIAREKKRPDIVKLLGKAGGK